jgi:hypothetical protein
MVAPTCMIFEACSSVKISIVVQITLIIVSEKRTATIFREGDDNVASSEAFLTTYKITWCHNPDK